MASPVKMPCAFFAQGKCRNGTYCKFYHAPREDLAVSPFPCKFFLQNACKADQEASMQVSASTGEKTIAPASYGVPCKFFKNGECAAGDRCPYVHTKPSDDSQPASAKPKPTKPSSVKMYVLNKKEKPPSDDKLESASAEAKAWVEDPSNQHVTELSDFISKEEELYYYGAPGEFIEVGENSTRQTETKPSYGEVAAKHLKADEFATFIGDDRPPAPPKTCTFFLQGLCRYGDSCFYSHALYEEIQSPEEMELMGKEIYESQDLECNICYDNILKKEERFGLLSGCTHAFCLSCVRNWRGNADQPKQSVRQCPVCRVETHFIIPSSRMVTDPARKKALIDEYRKNLAGIPCRHFDEGRGTCPFGTSCFYAHRYPDGTVDSRTVRTAVDADGQYDVLRQIRLGHYFE